MWTNIYQAYLKAMLSVWLVLPKKNILVSIGNISEKVDFLSSAKWLVKKWFALHATTWTHNFFQEHGVPSILVHGEEELKSWNNFIDMMKWGDIDFVINAPSWTSRWNEISVWYLMRRKAVDLSIPLLSNIKLANLLIQSLDHVWGKDGIEIMHYNEF